MEKSKAETFIGFAVKSRKMKTGFNSVETLKSAKLLILCKSAEKNSVNSAQKLKERFHCPLLITTEENLEDYVYKKGVKVMAITDGALAKAIYENRDRKLKEYSGDNNG